MKEQTLAILKPDCVMANKTGKVLDRIIQAEFNILAMKLIQLDIKTAGEFYAVHKERPFYNDLVAFMTSGPCIPIALEKENAVSAFRELIGATDPSEAAQGTIRKDFATSKQNNIAHGSDSPENAIIEVGFFFSKSEIIRNLK